MFRVLIGAGMLEEMVVDTTEFLITGPVDPLLAPSALGGRKRGWKREKGGSMRFFNSILDSS